MAEFSMKIAGHTARVCSLFESTPQYFRAYLTDEPGEFSFSVTREHIDFEQADLLEEAHRDGFRPRVFTDPFLERAAIQRAFAEYLFDRDILMLHGSTIAADGRGYLFTARSGTGKSTHTRLWQQILGNRAEMVNDDKPFLAITDTGVLAYGSPWSGKHGLDANICVPLQGICLLERAPENRIRPATAQELLPLLEKQVYCPADSKKQPQLTRLLQRLTELVPLWQLQCNKNLEAAELAFGTMSNP